MPEGKQGTQSRERGDSGGVSTEVASLSLCELSFRRRSLSRDASSFSRNADVGTDALLKTFGLVSGTESAVGVDVSLPLEFVHLGLEFGEESITGVHLPLSDFVDEPNETL